MAILCSGCIGLGGPGPVDETSQDAGDTFLPRPNLEFACGGALEPQFDGPCAAPLTNLPGFIGAVNSDSAIAVAPDDPQRILIASAVSYARPTRPVVYNFQFPKDIAAWSSTDGGRSWDARLLPLRDLFLDADDVDSWIDFGFPRLLYEADGAVIMVLSLLGDAGEQMVVLRSSDHGITWGDPTLLPDTERQRAAGVWRQEGELRIVSVRPAALAGQEVDRGGHVFHRVTTKVTQYEHLACGPARGNWYTPLVAVDGDGPVLVCGVRGGGLWFQGMSWNAENETLAPESRAYRTPCPAPAAGRLGEALTPIGGYQSDGWSFTECDEGLLTIFDGDNVTKFVLAPSRQDGFGYVSTPLPDPGGGHRLLPPMGCPGRRPHRLPPPDPHGAVDPRSRGVVAGMDVPDWGPLNGPPRTVPATGAWGPGICESAYGAEGSMTILCNHLGMLRLFRMEPQS